MADMEAMMEDAKGKGEELAGKLTDNPKMEAEGYADQVKAKAESLASDAKEGIENAAEKVKEAFDN